MGVPTVRNVTTTDPIIVKTSLSVQVGSEKRDVHARVAISKERPRLWAKAVEAYSGDTGYQESTDRVIPVVALTPRA